MQGTPIQIHSPRKGDANGGVQFRISIDDAARQWTGGGGGGESTPVPRYYFETPALFHDPPMTDEAWIKHHSWLRHLPEPSRLVLLVYGLWPVVAWVILVSVGVGLYATFAQPNGAPIAVDQKYIEPFIICSFAVALLLVFRANSSYERWWEARRAFGQMYNCVRILARQSAAWLTESEEERNLQKEVVRWASVLAYAACTFLRDDPNFLLENVADVLTPSELDWLLSCKQAPVAVLQVISTLLAQSKQLDYQSKVELERQLSQFDIVVGACERLRRQCIPLAYTRQTSRFIIIFVTFLPFGLWEFLHWLTIPVMAVIALMLVGIENIGIQLEQPLMVLPLGALAGGCRVAVESVGDAQRGAVLMVKKLNIGHTMSSALSQTTRCR